MKSGKNCQRARRPVRTPRVFQAKRNYETLSGTTKSGNKKEGRVPGRMLG